MQSIGRYALKRELGRGAMGVVYLAEDPAIGRPVAIKTINLDNLSEAGEEHLLRERLLREARSAGILSHPGIVTIYDIQQTEHLACIVMEFVEGTTILDKMLHGTLEPAEVLSMLDQTAAAMDYAHSKGVLHRDIKPANLMITSSGQVKIADFGIARLSSQKTATTGMVLGTPSYMAPEQISNKALSPATDQFSLGVVAFELLTGQKPFNSDSISGLLYSIVFQEPTALQQLNPTVSPAMETALRKALAKEPAERYTNCTEFIRALKTASESRQSWRPMRTVKGSTAGVPASIANLPAPVWRPEPVPPPETVAPPVPVAAPPAAAPPVVPAPPKAETKKPPPVSVATPRLPAAAAEPGAGPKKEGMKIAVAFGVGVLLIAGTYFLYSSAHKSDVASQQIASELPAPGGLPSDSKQAPSKVPQRPVQEKEKKSTAAVTVSGQKAPQSAPVDITSTPSGAMIIIKDLHCTSPCSLDVPYGEHYVTARLDGYKDTNQRIEVPKQIEVALKLEKPMGTIEVRGHAGATIYLNGQPWKDKAPARLTLSAGSYTLYLETPDGQKSVAQKFEIEEGKIIEIN